MKAGVHVLHYALVRSLKKKMHRVSAQMYLRATVQNGVSRIHPQLLFFAAKVQISTSESGPKWRFRTRKAAATFSLSIHQYGRSFFLFYIEKMAACNFLSAMKILICYGTAEIYIRLFGTAQMIGRLKFVYKKPNTDHQ